jgi:hypothetical protein
MRLRIPLFALISAQIEGFVAGGFETGSFYELSLLAVAEFLIFEH